MPIPPKPPWYSTPTAIVSLPTAAPNCNSLIESPTDTPATENRKNKSNNNNNDRPDDDDDNNDDVDCFPRQDKQPVLPQDISPTDTLPSLIESTTDTPTAPMNFENNNNNNNNDPSDDDDNDNDDCFPSQATLPVLQQDTPRWKHEQDHLQESTQASFHDGVPLLVWDSKQYQLDYNHNHRPISVWDGTTYTHRHCI